MHTYTDTETGVVIHHNGDYSGTARIMIPLKREPRDRFADVSEIFDIADDSHEINRKMGWPDDTYGITFDTYIDGQPHLTVTLPARLLVRFGAGAAWGGLISIIEGIDLDKVMENL